MALRIGFVGTGGIARTHMDALARLNDLAQMTAFCDLDETRAQEAAARYQGKAYTDFEQMFKEEPLDGVIICVPPHAHVGAEERAAEKGIHIFVEKPVARTTQRAKEIEHAIQKSGIINGVGYHFRAYGATDRAVEMLRGTTIGMAMGYWNGGMPGVGWWRKHELSGGQIVEQTTHIFDLARYLVGEIEEVSAYFAQRVMHLEQYPDSDVADVGVVSFKFENGAVGTMVNTALMNIAGKVGLDVITQNRVVEVSWGFAKAVEANQVVEYRSHDNPYYNEDKLFLEAIQKKDQSLIRCSYADGVKTLAVTLAADESARLGRPVKVSEMF
ncbi:MAG: Gfo/Idh/MocA family oxidoreductase [Fimbriimonadia bacterium]|nr:Gfo/Idh/MocA family oxidoreductase [Fimbriimonadia bacterium]